MKIKQDFITNSSSTSFVVISDSPLNDIPDYKNEIMVVDSGFGMTEFGWGMM